MTQTEFSRKPESNQPLEEMLLLNMLGKLTHCSASVHVAELSPEKPSRKGPPVSHSSDMKPILTSVLVIIVTLRE